MPMIRTMIPLQRLQARLGCLVAAWLYGFALLRCGFDAFSDFGLEALRL